MTPISILFISVLAALIGALPFGLVNLTVLNVAQGSGKATAMKVAHGAALIEVVFGFMALFAGSFIVEFTKSHELFHKVIIFFPAVIALVFFLKKNSNETEKTKKQEGFLKGMFLNLISIQVLLYWLFALTYINTRWQPDYNIVFILLFAFGIWLGKIAVLWLYSLFSRVIHSKSEFFSRNINRIIGSVLLLSAFAQFLK